MESKRLDAPPTASVLLTMPNPASDGAGLANADAIGAGAASGVDDAEGAAITHATAVAQRTRKRKAKGTEVEQSSVLELPLRKSCRKAKNEQQVLQQHQDPLKSPHQQQQQQQELVK